MSSAFSKRRDFAFQCDRDIVRRTVKFTCIMAEKPDTDYQKTYALTTEGWEPITRAPHGPASELNGEELRLTELEAIALMDELYRSGVRPTFDDRLEAKKAQK